MSRRLALPIAILAACGSSGSRSDLVDAAIAPIDAAAIDATPADARGPSTLVTGDNFTVALGSLCGLGLQPSPANIWLYPCGGAEVHGVDADGEFAGIEDRPGESADDADIFFTRTATTIGGTSLEAGAMMFINGETGVAEVYLAEDAPSTPLVTGFGESHVVGGDLHQERGSLFLVQDRNAATTPNTIAEVALDDGAVTNSFSVAEFYDVNFGDLAVCQANGDLFVVSSVEATLLELTPAGDLVAEHPLPEGVSGLSGLGLGEDGTAWVVGTGGGVWQLTGVPCGGDDA